MRRAHTVAAELAAVQAAAKTRRRPAPSGSVAEPSAAVPLSPKPDDGYGAEDDMPSAHPNPAGFVRRRRAQKDAGPPRSDPALPRQLHALRSDADASSGAVGGLRANRSMNDLRREAVAQHVTQKEVVVVLAEMLNAVAQLNRRAETELALAHTPTSPITKCKSASDAADAAALPSIARFEGASEPKVSIEWYLWRLVYYLNRYPRVEETFFAEEAGTIPADFSPGRTLAQANMQQDSDAVSRGLRALLLALVYVDRVCAAHSDFVVTPRALHRVMLTAMLVATKFSDDLGLGAEAFAKLGGIQAREMAAMELAFCGLIAFQLNVSPQEFDAKCMKNLGTAFDIAAQRNRRARDAGAGDAASAASAASTSTSASGTVAAAAAAAARVVRRCVAAADAAPGERPPRSVAPPPLPPVQQQPLGLAHAPKRPSQLRKQQTDGSCSPRFSSSSSSAASSGGDSKSLGDSPDS